MSTDSLASKRVIYNKREFSLKSFFLQWEWLLILILVFVIFFNGVLSPYFLNVDSILGSSMTFLDKSFIVFPMVLIMIMREIDISVGSTVAFSAVTMGVLYNVGVPMSIAVLICVLVGALCGFLNGYLIVKYQLSAVIVTLSTMILYRGLAYVLLEDESAGGFPEWFNYFGWGYIGGIPFILLLFV